ncbi:MAG: hypothetical protein LBB41_04035, partial [Prevotellaceae bacterium]|nr:hypothetical protein [Prevotellaceae bacterium]
MNLAKFQNENLYDATTSFFKDELCVKIKSFTAKNLSVKDFFENDFSIISETYFIGTIDKNIFSDRTDEAQQDFERIKRLATDNEKIYEGLMVFAAKLSEKPNRTLIAEITRAFNRWCKAMPVAIVFRYENYISFAISERFLYRQSWLHGEKVGKTIILRDIDCENPHAGHLRILQDLANHNAHNFNELHKKWLS